MAADPSSTPAPTAVRLAQAAAILLATTTAGADAALSFFAVPRILEGGDRTGAGAARAWAAMFAASSRALPVPMVAVPAALNAFLAWRAPAGRARAVYVAAAAATLSIAPFTYAFMGPINRQLAERARRARAAASATAGGGGGGGSGDVTEGEPEAGKEVLAAEAERQTAHALVDAWATRNLYRCTMSFLAGCAGLYAALF
ncbi:hypothetical protein DL762_006403 [Monosporascus cannonballus]|uniref:DUF1772 domain-containing protein n=1 Tax=Monosporascus cannonballus TaxID=155416 RepID=A0ABY0H256_9PEZI|nr:hypothetical protein DL762_006403 [Monosporascus cannonballus]RYO86476.1 hypothetical protein DL763_006686 [Monosporascus cannonballus]